MPAINKQTFFQKINYTPHNVQGTYHDSPARFRVACCGRRMGKSTMAARDKEPTLFTPKTRGWIVGPTYDLGEKEFRVLWDDLIIGLGLGNDKRVKKGYSVKTGSMYIELPWQSRVEVRSSDHPETLVGEGLDWLILSEAAKHRPETWEKYLRPALADKKGSADFPTTPEGQNWLYRLWQLGRDPSFAEWASWQFPSWENTHVFPGGRQDPEIVAVERTTTKEWFAQEYGAEFTAFVGKIFDDWNEKTHVTTTKYNPALPSYIAFDWGFTNPFAAIEFQVGPSDTIYVWREYYKPGLTLTEHIQAMQARPQPEGYRLDLGFGDPAEPAAIRHMTQHFVPTIGDPDIKEKFTWRQGVDRIADFLKEVETGYVQDEYGTPVKAPRFFVDFDCTQFIHEMNNYRSKQAPRTMIPQDPSDAPIKKDDHGIDALRYALLMLFDAGATRHLHEIYDRTGLIRAGQSEPTVHTEPAFNASGMYPPRELQTVFSGLDSMTF